MKGLGFSFQGANLAGKWGRGMFLAVTPKWQVLGDAILAGVAAPQRLALVVVQAGDTGPEGFVHRGTEPIYPCSLVKTFHLVHALSAVEEGRVAPHGELDRAMRDMIRWSSNTATNYVIDLITGTTGERSKAL